MWCTYISRHPSGKYYIGKGKTELVLNGKYRGSGRRFKDFMKKYPDGWVTEVIETFENEQDAYDAEEALVTADLLSDPMCLNLKTGGRKAFIYSEETKALMAEKARQVQTGKPKAEEHKAKILSKLHAWLRDPANMETMSKAYSHPHSEETKIKIGNARRGQLHTEETKAKIGSKLKGRVLSEETKAKMRKPRSEETKEKIRLASIKREAEKRKKKGDPEGSPC